MISAPGAALGIGLPPGSQPCIAKDGGWLLAADARLDNREELEERIGGQRGRLDADLLLALWQRNGEESLAWIAGDFALAVFDPRNRSLSLARDVTGQRPLFYTRTDFGIAFASMPAALRPVVTDFGVDRRSLALMAMDSPLRDGESVFDRISSVRQAEVVRFSSDGGITRLIYWMPAQEPPDHGDRRALIEEYRHVLEQAVRPRLGSASTVATHLSGGFDSSSVAATAARLLGDPRAVIGFTSASALETPAEKKFGFFAEESDLAAEVAAKYGFRHVIVRATTPIPDTLRSQSVLLQQPIREPFNGAWWVEIEARAAAMGATRLLTGELGNLTINAGNLADLSEWVRRRRWVTWYNQARAAAGRADVRWRGVLYNSFRPWMPLPLSSALERIFLHQRPSETLSFVRPDWRHLRFHHRPASIHAERLSIIRSADSASVRKAALALHGIEESDPFSDRRLIEFAFRIPPDQLYWNGVQRPLMRDALADRLPASLFKKFGRGLQSGDWAIRLTQVEAFGLLEEISASRVARDLLDLERMRRAIERWPTSNWNDPSVSQEFRLALIDAIAVGMFAAAYD